MPYLTWSENYSVGDAEMDSQHKRLFQTLNKLHDAMLTPRSGEACDQVIQFLLEYAQSHFSAEEALMLRIGYPAYSVHKAAHDQFAGKVKAMQARAVNGEQLARELFDFLNDWLLRHILVMDKKYTAYIRANDG
jgi:hemerythrin-like metal-binding protein